jgi:hypothetical protein
MKKLLSIAVSMCLIIVLVNCSDTNTVVNAGNSSNQTANDQKEAEEGGSTEEITESVEPVIPAPEKVKDDIKPKTDAEVVLAGAEMLLNTTADLVRKRQIKDSINMVYRERFYAFQIGMEQDRNEAFDSYKRLAGTGIKYLYVFKISRKKYCIVKYQAKTEDELNKTAEDFKNELGDNANEGVKVINLMDFCKKRESINRTTENEMSIKCLVCD